MAGPCRGPSVVVVALLGVGFLMAWHRGGPGTLEQTEARLQVYNGLRPAEQAATTAGSGSLVVRFLGTSSLLLTDTRGGSSHILTDGFFTRSAGGYEGGIVRSMAALMLTPTFITPNRSNIQHVVDKLGLKHVEAIAVLHSHHDHSMDSGVLCKDFLSCDVIGSTSTAHVARSSGLQEDRIQTLTITQPPPITEGKQPEPNVHQLSKLRSREYQYGAFRLTFIRARHVPLPLVGRLILHRDIAPGFRMPAHVSSFLEGGSFSLLVEHACAGGVLIQGSANYYPGALRGLQAETVFLGIAGISRQTYGDAYFREVVLAVGAKVVVPIHWDDFTVPLSQPVIPPGATFEADMRWLRTTADRHGVVVKFLRVWDQIVLGKCA